MANEEDEPMDIIDFEDFVFKDWFFDSSSNLHQLFKNEFSAIDLQGMKRIEKSITGEVYQDWKYEILENIRKNFPFFNHIFILFIARCAKVENNRVWSTEAGHRSGKSTQAPG